MVRHNVKRLLHYHYHYHGILRWMERHTGLKVVRFRSKGLRICLMVLRIEKKARLYPKVLHIDSMELRIEMKDHYRLVLHIGLMELRIEMKDRYHLELRTEKMELRIVMMEPRIVMRELRIAMKELHIEMMVMRVEGMLLHRSLVVQLMR